MKHTWHRQTFCGTKKVLKFNPNPNVSTKQTELIINWLRWLILFLASSMAKGLRSRDDLPSSKQIQQLNKKLTVNLEIESKIPHQHSSKLHKHLHMGRSFSGFRRFQSYSRAKYPTFLGLMEIFAGILSSARVIC